ncbi:MAG: hydrolase [Methylococcales bacterium]|nr:hydrolase [Methylococcales bacterium]
MNNNLLFKPAWWLKNCHVQTLFPALFRRVPTPELQRERLVTPDGDFLDIDWCAANTDSPIVILLHGLSGSSKSGYIKGLQQALQKNNFRSVALNFRGCSGTYNNTSRCYHSGETSDLDFLYRTLQEREPDTHFSAVGFSLGANVLLKWLGEKGNSIHLASAVAVSTPFVLGLCATKLDKGFSTLYRTNLLRELKTYMEEKRLHLETQGHFFEAEKIKQCGDLSKITSFWEYDNRVVAKLYGFKNAHDYYAQSSSRKFLNAITVPTLLIQAQDDPFMTVDVVPNTSELPSCVKLELTQHGGHVGFISGKNPLRPIYWLEERIVAFLSASL